MLESVLAVLLALMLAQLIATLESMLVVLLVVLLDGGIIGRDSAAQRLYMYWSSTTGPVSPDKEDYILSKITGKR